MVVGLVSFVVVVLGSLVLLLLPSSTLLSRLWLLYNLRSVLISFLNFAVDQKQHNN